jgi:uncharacterized protein YndB with AHSA1/START domain
MKRSSVALNWSVCRPKKGELQEMRTTGPGHTLSPKIKIERVFDASRARLFEMWSRPAHLQMWSAPKGFTIPDARMDFHTGGTYGAHMRSPAGEDHRVQGKYLEIADGEGIVMTHAWVDEAGTAGPETRVTVTFEDYGHGMFPQTKMTFVQEGFVSTSSRDGHEAGWKECFDRLEAYLASVAG